MPEKRLPSRKTLKGRESRLLLLRSSDRSREKYVLKLYISGTALRSKLAIENIRRVCEDYLPDCCDLEIIDIITHPMLAKEAQIICVPTLIKQSPLPVHRLVGDMSQTEKVLAGLEIGSAGRQVREDQVW